jgi:hypothetical protein
MPPVFPGAPFPVFQDPNQQAVQANAALAANGSAVFTGYGVSEISLFVNVKNAPTGTTPTLQYTLQEVDPGDNTTPRGPAVSTTLINAIGIQRISLESAYGGNVKVSWFVIGAGASFTGVYATLVGKAGATKLTDASGTVVGTLADGSGLVGLAVSLAGTNFPLSTLNSSTAQLASGATYTGAIETIYNEQAISVLVTSDQPGTLILNQYIDAAGTRKISSWPFAVAAGQGFSRSFVANGNYFNLTFQNTGPGATTTLNVNTAFGILGTQTNLGNAPVAINEVNGTMTSAAVAGGVMPVGLTDGVNVAGIKAPALNTDKGVVVAVSPTGAPTYSACLVGLVAAATPTDIATLTGSASKTIYPKRILISGTQTTAAVRDILLVKRSTADTGGTTVPTTAVAWDSRNAPATAVVVGYTANPTALGAAVGNLEAKRVLVPTATGQAELWVIDFATLRTTQPVALIGVAQQLAINLNGITSAGNNFDITIEWTEE